MIDFEHLLPLVEKPSRYINHEINAHSKSFDQAKVRLLFAFPDVYELGISHLGLKILYSIVNRLDYAMADRLYLPAMDFIRLLEKEELPFFGLESRRPASDFDLLGITLQSELTFTNVLQLLKGSRLPLFSAKRTDEHPIVMAGGPCASNPLPLVPFIDVFFIGEAEEAIVEIAEILKAFPDRSSRLKALENLPGCFVPKRTEDSLFDFVPPKSPIKIRKYDGFHTGKDKHEPQLMSWQLATHNRYVAEIMRGCSRGCRFCHAGYFYRPVRERDAEQILNALLKEAERYGWDEAGLVSLSSSDYSCIRDLLHSLLKSVDTKKTHISLPSLRADSLDDSLVTLMQSLGREGLTIAPEAGSQRLRDVINKNLDEAEILKAVEIAQQLGWQKIKLYFMIGLPTETDADIEAIISLVHRINNQSGKRLSISVGISPFTPKPFTPFQWAQMLAPKELLSRATHIKKSFTRQKNIRVKYHIIENSLLDACLSRGDLRMSRVLYRAWENGAIFDGWQEFWRWDIWEKAFADEGLSPADFTKTLPLDEPLPWDFIDIGVDKSFLKAEHKKSLEAALTEDCRFVCSACGVCDERLFTRTASSQPLPEPSPKATEPTIQDLHNQFRYRVFYSKTGLLRFISHLDWMRMLFRRISSLKLDTVYTMGFSPHPKLSLSPPLPVGVESLAEFFDISFYSQYSEEEILAELGRISTPKFSIISCQRLLKKAAMPLSESLIIRFPAQYQSLISESFSAFENSESCVFTKTTDKKSKSYELKEIVLDWQLRPQEIELKKSLQSPSLYDVFAHLFSLSKEELFRFLITRRSFHWDS